MEDYRILIEGKDHLWGSGVLTCVSHFDWRFGFKPIHLSKRMLYWDHIFGTDEEEVKFGFYSRRYDKFDDEGNWHLCRGVGVCLERILWVLCFAICSNKNMWQLSE